MIEEIQHERGINLLHVKGRRRNRQSLAHELEEQLEGVGVRVLGVRTRASLDRQPLQEECADVGRDGGHWPSPFIKASTALAMSPRSSGVACKYQ